MRRIVFLRLPLSGYRVNQLGQNPLLLVLSCKCSEFRFRGRREEQRLRGLLSGQLWGDGGSHVEGSSQSACQERNICLLAYSELP